ncbi:hypothetical protein [Streptomyces sp. NPDC002962]|uniref:hypothetical protein n=1 Tax=Streptomyces sp. NPDC002962 TaxID=3364674 RepID=UPI00369C6C07
MGKSATVLGREIGKTGREMNVLLHRHGYLTGGPGAYALTEKGGKYGSQEEQSSGDVRSPSYYRQWTVTTWSDELLAALLNDMANASAPSETVGSFAGDDASVAEDEPLVDTEWEATDARLDLRMIVIAVGLLAATKAAQVAAPHAQRWWVETAVPATSRALRRLKRQEPSDDEADD